MQVNKTCVSDYSTLLTWMLALPHRVPEANLGKEDNLTVIEQTMGGL